MNDLLRHHGDDDRVAFGEGGPRTAADLRRDVATVAAALRTTLPDPPPGPPPLMVFEHERYAFAVGPLAAWAAGLAVALPPNGRAQTIAALLERPEIGTLLHDTRAGGHLCVPALLTGPAHAPGPPLAPPRPIAATVFTSGTTGDSEAWPKTPEQLLGEVAVLAQTFAIPPGSRSVVTVPPSHLYGLLFGVLLPLHTGGAFLRETPLLPEAVAARVWATGADTLVSVPVHLRTAQAIDAAHLASLRRVFSSTAPLDEGTARAFATTHQVPITEIFGSTETGGIAWRRREQGDPWHPLAGVSITIDDHDHLRVDSPFLPPDADRPWTTADLAEPGPGGSFVHRGRADGVVKVGGRRVSLPQLQRWLLSQPGVLDAEVAAVPAPGRGMRLLAAVVAPGQREDALRQAMVEHFPPSTVPRRLLLVDQLPREPSGKLPRRLLLALFGLRPDGTPPSTRLVVSAPAVDPDDPGTFTAAVTVPADYVYFDGHFDTYPILAGVVQLHEVLLPLVGQARPAWGPLRELLRVKFLGRIVPGDQLQVTLRLVDERSTCDFEISRGDQRLSGGQLRFAPPPESVDA
ncbi:MAG: acyl-CoA synthetase [Myxococcales bacterium]|nr:acyl-CoA synthetase [Myxococcales bacterium]